jgi:linearmycin/streptolysin S transport system permease protein
VKKALNIAWKDLRVAFRDPAAIILMLITPFLLTVVMGFAFGGLGGNSSAGISQIPIAVVNHDAGQVGQNLVQVLQSQDLADLVKSVVMTSDAQARLAVDRDQVVVAVIIPSDLTARVIPQGEQGNTGISNASPVLIEIYSSPTNPVSASVVRSIVDQFLSRIDVGVVSGRVAVEQLLASGRIDPQQAASLGRQIGTQAGQASPDLALIHLQEQTAQAGQPSSGGFDWMAYMAPSMAILFLMFTVTTGGRSILAEREGGTLPRMLASPTSTAMVLGGKVLGIFLTGALQVALLILASALLLHVRWGSPLAVGLLTLAVAAGATGWGTLLAAYSRTPGQASATGTALALIFGAASGNFVPRQALPVWLQVASSIAPNSWGLEGFQKLAAGGSLAEIWGPVIALSLMTIVLFLAALLAFRRQYRER